ncbi:TIGR00153 family protein [Gilvimarinus sp. SDUM040013]|uniref:TIGR00153 family protein n=1 Tax=Gilvimarinus gilvus TaxID=3058038 RepID=A0ABU4RYA2_9GAMM|nr:TIGR00153 family protein [Gilvimarinus sp. SDUM040013]MDO3387408.1 TIGR00153 family protein [Gilvimarinus sp. SDUM040013]MDX6849885.1 TIGR00153 family protein [Gilvimarinus sp. SDUM040013]
MAFSNPFSNMFGQSPIKPMQEHMSVAVKASSRLSDFFEAVIAGDWDKATIIQKEISDIEHQADDMKKQLRLHLPKSLFLPVPRTDLLELLSMQDRIANKAQDISGIMLGRKMSIPATLQQDFVEFVDSALHTAEQALIAINELDELLETGFSGRELDIVENMIEKLDQYERTNDALQVKIRAALFKLEANLPPVDVMFLYQVIDWIGELADRSQSVGSRLQLLLAR